MQKLAKILGNTLFLIIIVIAAVYGGGVKGGDQLEIYKTLLTVSSIVFAIMGAWLSLLKIEIVQGVRQASSDSEGESYVDKARSLVGPMSSSAIIIALCLLFVFLYYSLNQAPFVVENVVHLRRLSFVILSWITCWQMVSLIRVMFSGVDFLIDVSRMNKELTGDRKR